jgi:hypothetical protein
VLAVRDVEEARLKNDVPDTAKLVAVVDARVEEPDTTRLPDTETAVAEAVVRLV